MSNISSEKLFEKSLELVVHADELTYKWTTHLVTVQSSLVAVIGGILVWNKDALTLQICLATLLVSMLGIVLAFALCHIVIREHDHGHAYIAMLKRSEGDQPVLFRDEDPALPGPSFRTVFLGLKWALITGWVFVAVASLVKVASF